MARTFDSITIYLTPEQRAQLEHLREVVKTATGLTFTDNRGYPSYSGLIRWMLNETLRNYESEQGKGGKGE